MGTPKKLNNWYFN